MAVVSAAKNIARTKSDKENNGRYRDLWASFMLWDAPNDQITKPAIIQLAHTSRFAQSTEHDFQP